MCRHAHNRNKPEWSGLISCSYVRPVHDKQRAVRNFLLASIILFFSPIWPINLRTVQCYLNLQDLSNFSSVTYWAPLLLVYLLKHPRSEAVEMPGWKTGIASYPCPLGTRLRQALTQCVFTVNHRKPTYTCESPQAYIYRSIHQVSNLYRHFANNVQHGLFIIWTSFWHTIQLKLYIFEQFTVLHVYMSHINYSKEVYMVSTLAGGS